MLLAQILTLTLLSAGILIAYFCLRKNSKALKIFILILSIVLGLVFFVRYMCGNEAIDGMFALQGSPFGWSAEFITVISMLSIWLTYACILILILYPYFKLNFLTHIIKFFVLPCSLLFAVWIKFSTIGIMGADIYSGTQSAMSIVRTIFMAIEIALIFGMSFIVFFENGKFKSTKRDWITFAYAVPLLLFCIMPGYTLQVLFGSSTISEPVKSFSQTHRIILYLSFIVPLCIYFLLRKKDDKTIKFAMLFLSLGTLIIFSLNHKLATFASPLSWPIHLCNTAMYIVPLCIIFKWNKLFYFTVFINVLGAFFAMALPNYASTLNIFSMRIYTFYINHFIAFFMPFLMIALKMYPRPKLKHFIYSMVAFAIYFVFILFINAWFSNYGTVDFFFVNSDFIASKLGKWAEDLRNIVWVINVNDLKLVFYPLYQFLFFLVYVILGLGMWFVYEMAYKITDKFNEMANIKQIMKLEHLELLKNLNKRSEEEPMNTANKNQLVINNFSKKYGNSKTFAVENANFKVESGDIFGFLGPNGSGKSTIIKSIVGIQSITSGSIEVFGYDVAKQPVMAKKQIGFVPDHYALYEKLTGREYLNYIADLYDVSQTLRDERLNKYIELLQLTTSIDNPIKTYSHGMKQKVTIISALVHEPKLWILDEPLTGLDPNSIYQVKECMKEHAKKGNIVFFSSHIIDVVEKICDKIAVIKNGTILTVKSMNEIEKEYKSLENFYLTTIDQMEIKKENNKEEK